jgi:hypothetical protein
MKTLPLEDLLPLVMAEAQKLKPPLTQKERNALDMGRFSAHSASSCIYGQMTGHCNSERAIELIHAVCQKAIVKNNFQYLSAVNGPAVTVPKNPNEVRHQTYLSAIELVILTNYLGYAAAERIMAYLKDETSELNLSDLKVDLTHNVFT